MDFEDLTVFVRLWYWSAAQQPASKVTFERTGPALDHWLPALDIPGGQVVQYVVPAPPLPEVGALRLRWEFDPELLTLAPADSGTVGGILRLSQQGDTWVEVQQAVLETGKILESYWKVHALVAGIEIEVPVEYEIRDWEGQLLAQGRLMQPVRSTKLPTTYALHLAVPNPFNPETTIRYEVADASRVLLAVYNMSGQRVRVLRDEKHAPGYYQVLAWIKPG